MVAMGKGEYCQARVRRLLLPQVAVRRRLARGRPSRTGAATTSPCSSTRSPSCSARATCRPTWCSSTCRRPTSTASARSASRWTTPSRPPRSPRPSSPRSTPTCRAPTAIRSSTSARSTSSSRATQPIIELQPPRIGPVEEAIGKHIAGLVDDGSCLQLGIGGIPDAVLALSAREERPRHPQRDVQRRRRRPLQRGRHHQPQQDHQHATRWRPPSSWARAACTTSSTTTPPSTCSP